MVQRDTHLFALVLEDVHVGDLAARAQLAVAVGPDVDEKPHPVERKLRQRELVLRRVDDDLTAGHRGRTGRPPRRSGPNAGNRFSNTTTSNVSSGTSEAPPSPVGHSGQNSVGRKVRSLRSVA